jgi:hypothetical protein
MDHPLRTIVVLGPLALLCACLQVAPRSSVPFQTVADREARYAAEATLAIKEDRQVSEAAVNARMVLPELPEVWGLPKDEARAAEVALEPEPLEVGAASGTAAIGCAPLRGGAPLADCRRDWGGRTLILPPSDYDLVRPAAAPTGFDGIEEPVGFGQHPSG